MESTIPEVLRRFDLTGRVAVVTGASSGLGALARTLASVGARVVAVARRKDRLAELAAEIGGVAMARDLLAEAQLTSLVPQVAAEVGPPEILVNVAGDIFSRDPAEAEPLNAVRRTFDLNLLAPFRLCQDVFPHMAALRQGSLVHISSISGMVGMPGAPQASYAASKQALSGLTTELAVQCAPRDSREHPRSGVFRSEINDELYRDEEFRAWLERSTPLPADARFDDFDAAVLWLASDAARHVTGQTIVIDGGWTIQ